MQSWTPDLGASVAPRSRPAVHARPVMARVSLRRAANRRVPLHGAANRRAANCGASVRHHLIDIRDPAMTYSAGDFVVDAAAAMEEIWRRGRQPLFVGGTMLYFHTLSAGIAALPDRDPDVRAEIDARAAAIGWAGVHRELAAVDPDAAARIHASDPQRIQRAMEVYRLTGQPISRLQQSRVSALAD